MKDNNKEVKISFWAAHATTVISVSLVLFLIGIIAVISLATAGETRRLKEQIEISAVLSDSLSNQDAAVVLKSVKAIPEVKNCCVVTKEQAMAEWKESTGEDLEEVFGVNIFSPEISLNLKAEFTDPASIAAVKRKIAEIDGVEEVVEPDSSVVKSMNENISLLSVILAAVAVVMIVVSCVLINNTVHLTIYSKRFTIHTMQLVGATNGFIRRPLVMSNMLAGLIAGIIASAVVAAVIAFAPSYGLELLTSFIPWTMYAFIAAALILLGVAICGLAAAVATARFLRKDYGELFK